MFQSKASQQVKENPVTLLVCFAVFVISLPRLHYIKDCSSLVAFEHFYTSTKTGHRETRHTMFDKLALRGNCGQDNLFDTAIWAE